MKDEDDIREMLKASTENYLRVDAKKAKIRAAVEIIVLSKVLECDVLEYFDEVL